MAAKTIQNPKLSFYSLLLRFFHLRRFSRDKAEQLIQMSLKHDGMTLERLDMKKLEGWHRDYHYYTDTALDYSEDVTVHITKHCFVDFAHQIRNEAVQKLFLKWKKISGTEKDLFVHVHTVISRGGVFGEVHTICDDYPRYLAYLDDPDVIQGAGMIHRSWFDENKKLHFSA